MIFLHLVGALRDSALAVGRWLWNVPWWAPFAVGAAGIIVMTVPVFIDSDPPSDFTVIVLACIAMIWIAVSLVWARLTRTGLEQQKAMLTEMDHLIGYVQSMNGVMEKLFNELATYDRDKAIELAHEMNSISSKSLYDAYWREEMPSE